jgi:hypothetical protein
LKIQPPLTGKAVNVNLCRMSSCPMANRAEINSPGLDPRETRGNQGTHLLDFYQENREKNWKMMARLANGRDLQPSFSVLLLPLQR